MVMDDDDDDVFGDLYADVVRPISTAATSPPRQVLPLPTATTSPDCGPILPSEANTGSTSLPPLQKPAARIQDPDPREGDNKEDWILGPTPIPEEQQLLDWNEDDEVAILLRNCRPPVSGDAGRGGEVCGVRDKDEMGGIDQKAEIPGLSGTFASGASGGKTEAEGSDWDSDDGDDFQIVLNDDGINRRAGVTSNEGVEGKHEDEDELVVVADEVQLHQRRQTMEENCRAEALPAVDSEEKDVSEVAKGSAGIGAVPGSFGSHVFHPREWEYSQLKYVSAGATPGPGKATGVAGGTNQIHHFPTGSDAGGGRDLGFHTRNGLPAWAERSAGAAQPFGTELKFRLPSHKFFPRTIFDMDIDSFNKKPWKHGGVDISNFFNFELNEESWNVYCKQLKQLRLESTMQSKTQVYESGRSEQVYDPPELATASGLQDISTENPQVEKVDEGQMDLIGQGRGTTCMPPQLPIGQAIQVQISTVERLPSMDTTRPQYLKSDDIIEIVPQSSLDESERPENGALGDDHMEGFGGKDKSAYEDSKYYGPFPKHNGKREAFARELHSSQNGVPERDGILPFPPERTISYSPCSKMSPSSPLEDLDRHNGRQTPEQEKRDFDTSDESLNDVVSNRSTQIERLWTIFDMDIDSFNKKPWKHGGVDISDFFNFELNEESWNVYCKQLKQLRLESTMQSKTQVYESGRSEQVYDPPELATASGLQDISTENPQVEKVDEGQMDLIGQGRGTTCMPPQLPTGQAIQVQISTVERLPSIDTTRPQNLKSDDIIEIVPQGSLDESKRPENGALGDDHMEGFGGKDKSAYEDSKYYGPFPKHNGKREAFARELHSSQNGVPERDGILPFPLERTISYSPCSKMSPSSPLEDLGRHNGSQTPEKEKRDFDTSDESLNDVVSNQSTQIEKNRQKQKLDETGEANKTSEILLTSAHAEKLSSTENIDSEYGDRLDFDDGAEEREDMTSSDIPEDSSSSYSLEKQKLTFQVEQPADLDSGGEAILRTTIIDNTRAESGSSNNYMEHGEGCGDENIKDQMDRSSGDARRHPKSNKHSFRQRDDYRRASRHEPDQGHIPNKGKDSLHHTNVRQDLDTNMTHHTLGIDGSEKTKGRNSSGSSWQKRDIQVHGRKVKEEMGSRRRNKLRLNERREGGEDLYMRKQSKERYRKGGHEREVDPQKKEGSEISTSWQDNLDDLRSNRRKDAEHHRKEKVAKEILPGHRAGVDSSHSKKERVDDTDPRRKENLVRERNKTVDQHLSRHRDEGRRYKESEDRQRSKQVREDIRRHREREERGAGRDCHVSENKQYEESECIKDSSKRFNSDRDSILRGKRNEKSKGGELANTHTQHESHEERHARESQSSNEMESSRYGSPNSHTGDSLNSYRQLKREKHRNNTRSKEPESKRSSLAPSKRKHEDNRIHQTEKVNKYAPSDEGMKNGNGGESTLLKEHYHGNQKQEAMLEERTASDHEGQEELRRGRSKLERWTSHIDRDFNSTSSQSGFHSLSNMEASDNSIDATEMEANTSGNGEKKDMNVVQVDSEETEQHLEAVEEMKKQSERFKHPMHVEDDIIIKKVENEVPVIQGDTPPESEIKQERLARKRQWESS